MFKFKSLLLVIILIYTFPFSVIAQSQNTTDKVAFCLCLGGNQGHYLPHLALLNGDDLKDVQENGKSGYNWVVAPASSIEGDYGVTVDNTFFVKVAFVKKYMSSDDNNKVEVRTALDNWSARKMTETNGYYTVKIGKKIK